MRPIELRKIANPSPEDYFSEICVNITGDIPDRRRTGHINADLRCRMLFDCLVKRDRGGRSQENISITIPSASEMIDLILGTSNAFDSQRVVSVDFWTALVYYCQVFKGVMRNSPIQFSLSNAASMSRIFDRFEEYLQEAINNSEMTLANLVSWRDGVDGFTQERSLHLTLTQEYHNARPDSPFWTGGLRDKENATVIGFLPLPAYINQDVSAFHFRNNNNLDSMPATGSPIARNDNGIMLFFNESGLLSGDTAFITGEIFSYIPFRPVAWQRRTSMTPEIMNPDLVENGIQEGDLLDQSTINGFFNRISNFALGLYTKAATQASVITSLLVTIDKFAKRFAQNEAAIRALQDFNPVGCVVQFVGEMDSEQESYYQLCDGDRLRFNSEHENGAFYKINRQMWKLGNDGSEFNPQKRYHTPDLQGRFLVMANTGERKNEDLSERGVGSVGGEESYGLRLSDLPPHEHQHRADHGNTENSRMTRGGTNDAGWIWSSNTPGADSSSFNDGVYRTRGFDIGGRNRYEVQNMSDRTNINITPPFFAVNYYIRVRV